MRRALVPILLVAGCLEDDPLFIEPSTTDASASTTTTTDPGTSTSLGTTTTSGTTTTVGTTMDPTDSTTSTDTGTTGIMCGTAEILADGPVLYWRLGEPSGNQADDSSGFGQHGTYEGVELGHPGVAADGDTAVRFTGNIDSLASLASVNEFPTTAMTVEMWVKSSVDLDGGLLSYAVAASDNEIYFDDPSSIDIIVAGDTVETQLNVVDGEWHHIATTWRSRDGRYRIFLDGMETTSGLSLAAGATVTGGGFLVLGQDQDNPGGGFEVSQSLNGFLDEVVVYTAELSGERIDAHRRGILCE